MTESETKSWDPKVRPRPDVCPQKFCFSWVCEGDMIPTGGPRAIDSLDQALENLVTVPQAKCGSRPQCIRDGGEVDYYEPCEPELERAGLPWFYFISGSDQLVDELREEYITATRAHWDKS